MEANFDGTWLRKNYFFDNYRPQTKFAKVMFSQVSVCPRGMRGRGHMHGWRSMCGQGGLHGGGNTWQGTCMAGGACVARETCMVGGIHGRGHAW